MTLYESIVNEIAATPAAAEADTSGFAAAAQAAEITVSRNGGGEWLFRLRNSRLPYALKVSGDYRHMEKYLCGTPEEEAENFRFLLRTAFECRFCSMGIVSLHAACVSVGGFAVAFTGHSGMGKSTRAFAWERALGAQIISGDRPAVRLSPDGNMACGVPWDGKEQIFRDTEVPLRCILEVRRSPLNYIRRLTAEQARRLISQQCFIPMWDTDAAVCSLANVRRLVRTTPVYRVFCGPAEEDARAIYDILARNPGQIKEEQKDMKIKPGFVLRNVVDEYMVMPTGDNIASFPGAMVLNETSAFIFRQLQNPTSQEDILSAILNEFDVDAPTASKDLENTLNKFRDLGILEEQ